MIGLFFEVQTRQGHRDQYLDLAASLRPALDTIGGCLFIDRFQSFSQDNLLLSYQIWQDEGALTAWRVHAKHHRVQEVGREAVFSDYRIRVAQLIHEAKPKQTAWQPDRRTPYNDPARRSPTYMLIAESKKAELPVKPEWPRHAFTSVYREGQFAHLIDVPDPQAAIAFGERLFADASVEYVRVFEVMRDYGMFERTEAPQYYPPVERSPA
jgi:heme-degrading monooxygenase HmoA